MGQHDCKYALGCTLCKEPWTTHTAKGAKRGLLGIDETGGPAP